MTERDIFLGALEIADPQARAAFLDRVCGGDAALRERIDGLLRAYDDIGSFLERPLAGWPAQGRHPGTTHVPSPAEAALEFLEPPREPPFIGRLGPYDVESVVGRGGMGVVLKGRDPKLNRIVAIKVLAPELAAHGTARQRFLREAQAAAAVSHDHVVTVYAVEDTARLPYLVMEYIAGRSLQERIEQGGPLELKEILRIGRQIADGLAAAHEQGLIHRDIKPANILLENGVQRVKITDFGLARAVGDARMTQTGVVTGTPQYMSPEQACGGHIDHRSDLFSLGAVLYAMCTGRPPFRGENTPSVLRRVCEDDPRPIRELNPEIPRWLEEIVTVGLLAKHPDERLQSAEEVAALLNEFLAHLQRPPVTPPPTWSRPVRLAQPRLLAPRPRQPQRAVVLLIAGLALVVSLALLLSVGIYWSLPGRPEATWESGPSVRETLEPVEPIAPVEADERLAQPWAILAPHDSYQRQTFTAAVTPDDRVLLAGDSTGALQIWNLPGRELEVIWDVAGEHRRDPIRAMAMSADGRWVAVGYDAKPNRAGEVRLYPVQGQRLGPSRTLELYSRLGDIALSPDGQRLAVATTETTPFRRSAVTVHNTRNLEEVAAIGESGSGAHRLAFSPDGKTLLAAFDDETVRVIDVERSEIVDRLLRPATDLAFAPDGSAFAIAHEGSVLIYDASTRERRRVLSAEGTRLSRIAYHPDGRWLATGDAQGVVRLWNQEAGEVRLSLQAHSQAVTDLTFTHSAPLLITADAGQALHVWNLEERLAEEPSPAAPPPAE